MFLLFEVSPKERKIFITVLLDIFSQIFLVRNCLIFILLLRIQTWKKLQPLFWGWKKEPAINFGRFGTRVVTEHNILQGLIDQSKFSVRLSVRGLL